MQTSRYSLPPPCAGCRTLLPPGAVFCVECGLCMLDVTQGGTVIARAPLRTTVGEIGVDVPAPVPTLAQLRRELDVPAMSGEYVLLADDEIEMLEETEELDMEIVLDDLEDDPSDRTMVTRGPVQPAPWWDAPARGQTHVGPAPTR